MVFSEEDIGGTGATGSVDDGAAVVEAPPLVRVNESHCFPLVQAFPVAERTLAMPRAGVAITDVAIRVDVEAVVPAATSTGLMSGIPNGFRSSSVSSRMLAMRWSSSDFEATDVVGLKYVQKILATRGLATIASLPSVALLNRAAASFNAALRFSLSYCIASRNACSSLSACWRIGSSARAVAASFNFSSFFASVISVCVMCSLSDET